MILKIIGGRIWFALAGLSILCRMFFLGRVNDNFKLGEITDAIVYFGNLKDAKVPAAR